MKLICVGCNKTPSEIDEYVQISKEYGETPEEFVFSEEGTLDPESGQFLCTSCYIKYGQPSSKYGWKATTYNMRQLEK